MNVLVVGAGLSGAVAARLLAAAGHKVTVCEARPSVGGNCADELHRPTGLMLHKYGPHGFHTNSDKVWSFVNQFAKFNDFKLKVRGRVNRGGVLTEVPLPLTRQTLAWLDARPEDVPTLVFKDYSEKQWGTTWDQIPKKITARVPELRDAVAPEYADCWHLDKYQGVPIHGYTSMIQCMLDHRNIEVVLWEKRQWQYVDAERIDLMVYTGKLDEFFGFQHGHLPYRSLHIVTNTTAAKQGCPQINECNSFKKYTRTVDQSYWYDQPTPNGSLVTQEYPTQHVHGQNDPFYPMEHFEGVADVANTYRAMAHACRDKVLFLGRLATYRYLDMDMAIAFAMKEVEEYCK